MHTRTIRLVGTVVFTLLCAAVSWAATDNDCDDLPSQSELRAALLAATTAEGTGLKLNMWATVVNRDGIVCAVAFTGNSRGAQWPGSRVISAQKANTANAFSLDRSAINGPIGGPLALSTANLYSAVQPGGSLFGLQESNPVDTGAAYKGPSSQYGTRNDPLVGEKIGGVNVFGGGLALYARGGKIVGGVGVSGDTSCTDHTVAWRLRHNLNLDYLSTIPGVAGLFAGDAQHPDNIIFDITANPSGGTGNSATGFGHPTCLNNPPTTTFQAGKPVAGNLPIVR